VVISQFKISEGRKLRKTEPGKPTVDVRTSESKVWLGSFEKNLNA